MISFQLKTQNLLRTNEPTHRRLKEMDRLLDLTRTVRDQGFTLSQLATVYECILSVSAASAEPRKDDGDVINDWNSLCTSDAERLLALQYILSTQKGSPCGCQSFKVILPLLLRESLSNELLDAVFGSHSICHASCASKGECVGLLSDQQDASDATGWARACRIWKYLDDTDQLNNHCIVGLELCNDRNSHIILPAMFHALPSITDIAQIYKASQNESLSFMARTTVLCSVLPRLDVSINEETWIWEFLEACLQTSLAENGQQKLLRRRGLYILQNMIEKMDNAAWKQYSACFDTFEMEVEPHLIDQVWKTVSRLLATMDKSGVSWEWMRLLLRRIFLSPETPVLRKSTVFRLFTGDVGLHKIPVEFLFDTVLPALDSLNQSVGTVVVTKGKKKTTFAQDILDLVSVYVVEQYMQTEDCDLAREFTSALWNCTSLQPKLLTKLYEAIASCSVNMSTEMVLAVAESLTEVFRHVVAAYKRTILESLAQTLQHSKSSSVAPTAVLAILALYDGKKDDALMEWVRESCDAKTGGILATAFVDGSLQGGKAVPWDPSRGCSLADRHAARGIVWICDTASDLWPAIFKGAQHSAAATISWHKAGSVSRAVLLLEEGCRNKVLSGLGNGELVVRKDNTMMPPPANIESLLGGLVEFVLFHIRFVLDQEPSGMPTARSADARIVSVLFGQLVEQLNVLGTGFCSSMVLSDTFDNLVTKSAYDLDGKVEATAMLYAAVSSGGTVASPLATARKVLAMEFTGQSQVSRSIFHFCKWGTLAKLLEKIDDGAFIRELFQATVDAVESVPVTAVLPLFKVVKTATAGTEYEAVHLELVINTVFRLIDDAANTVDSMYMMDEICAILFRPALLMAEYENLKKDSECSTPVRDAFRRFLKMAGYVRPHINRVVLSRICAGWLDCETVGLTSLPYREDIATLLQQKEDKQKFDNISLIETPNQDVKLRVAPGTDDTSISRGFLLVFLSKLPDAKTASPIVLSELLHFLIKRLLKTVARIPPTSDSMMPGSVEYCAKSRALQGVCVMSRFVTSDIADHVCTKAFESMGRQNAHSQLRFFVEVYTMQCARLHPDLFGKTLVEKLSKRDLSLQMVGSLMLVAGCLLVGRYESEFAQQNSVNLRKILSTIIPWLASTQGFSRAVSQLLVHKLIPKVVDFDTDLKEGGDDWYLRSLYRFLDENNEMRRLRDKQLDFFERYDADSACTPEGIFALPVDENFDAAPEQLIDVIKETLRQVYEECRSDDKPMWRQLELEHAETNAGKEKSSLDDNDDKTVNFQRKIIPIDALNLAMDEAKVGKSRNAAGRKKQDLIVCASLVDKIPNLGGLARTSEIFAATKLIVPDIKVTKMDNFKTLSVSATDWIDIEECKENDLLHWLWEQKKNGYTIVGLEQTSSSESLAKYEFPKDKPIVLLLGKEKEGIPVGFLQAVDQCLEVPQLGVIRSLNVHVTGAIAIWEYTKQQLSSQSDQR